MGLENCDKNIWAVALRDIVYKKFINSTGKEALTYSEERRNQEIQANIQIIEKMIRALSKNENMDNFINSTLSRVTKEIEKIHINRVKELLIKALNQ